METGCMKCMLKPEIHHEVLNHLIIRIVDRLLDDGNSDNDINRSIEAGCFLTVYDREAFFINRREYFIDKNLCLGIF